MNTVGIPGYFLSLPSACLGTPLRAFAHPCIYPTHSGEMARGIFFLSRISSGRSPFAQWRSHLFTLLPRNAAPPSLNAMEG